MSLYGVTCYCTVSHTSCCSGSSICYLLSLSPLSPKTSPVRSRCYHAPPWGCGSLRGNNINILYGVYHKHLYNIIDYVWCGVPKMVETCLPFYTVIDYVTAYWVKHISQLEIWYWFVIDERAIYEHSALSMHCYTEHRDNFSFECFKFGIVKKTKPTLLDREEARFCTKFKTNFWGLNRMEIKRWFPIKFLPVLGVFIIIAILLTKTTATKCCPRTQW